MMNTALGPGMRRGCPWVWLGVALGATLGAPAPLPAQTTPPAAKGAAPAPKDAAKAEPKGADAAAAAPKDEPDADAAPAPAPEEAAGETAEVYKDERAEEALQVFDDVPGLNTRITSYEIRQVKGMAASQVRIDRQLLDRYVQAMAARLLDKANINALIDPPPGVAPNAAVMHAIQDAANNLIDPINTARQTKNTNFLNAYNSELLRTLPKLLDKNLVSRTEAMIVLGQTGAVDALPIFLKQLKDPKQTVQVKLWAARGISNIVGDGTKSGQIPAASAMNTGKAIADFLTEEKDTLWFLQMRALQALGSMRQAAVATRLQKAEMATVAMGFLADPKARLEVRAQAAWALGMLQVPSSINGYNFTLVAHETGRLAAEIGGKINTSFGDNPTTSGYLTGLLVGPLYQAYNGVEGARESGLLHAPGASQAQGFISKAANLTSAVARASVELIRASKGQQPGLQKALGERVAELKTYLDKNPPKDYHLVPGGPEFKAEQAQVADAPAGAGKLAGVPGGE